MPFVPPVDMLNPAPITSWGNLGDWSEAADYPTAARALAYRMGRVAGLVAGDRVVEAGCGAGDAVALWMDDFGAARVDAVELDVGLAARADSRCGQWGCPDRARVRHGDATSAVLSEEPADHVLAVDAAYFFRPFDGFLRRAYRTLSPGGRLTFSYVVRGVGRPAVLASALSRVAGIPSENLTGPRALSASVRSCGFAELSVLECTDDVLRGFSDWVTGRTGTGAPDVGRALRWFGHALGWLVEHEAVRYVIVTARRPAA